MRKDLNKVLCERERHRSKSKFGDSRNQKEVTGKHRLGTEAWPFPGESTSPYPKKVGVSRPLKEKKKVWGKDLNENLNALWGFLRKSVGKNWDQVYSEICQTFDKRKVVNQHILTHLFEAVEVQTRLQGNDVCFLNVAGRGNPASIGAWAALKDCRAQFYIHPVSKILMLNKNRFSYSKMYEKQAELNKTDRDNHLVLLSKFNNQNGNGARYAIKINAIWYEISVIKKPEPVKRRKVDMKTGETVYFTDYPSYEDISIASAKHKPKELEGTNPQFYVSRKTQLSSNNLKKLGLRNG